MANKTSANQPASVRKERTQFRSLILGNPNYFGTLKESELKAVQPLQEDTAFEQLMCVGFNQQLNLLEGVVWIKQESGYGGDICSAGTQEYVSFFVDWNNNGTWASVGTTSFTAHDIPGQKPLEFAVSLQISPYEKFCFFDNLPNVRAILSWNTPPTGPGFIPVFGNVVEGRIQIEPLKFILLSQLLAEAKVKLPEEFASAVDLSQSVAAAKPQTLNLAERVTLYKDKGVPSHRIAFAEAHSLLTEPTLTESLAKAFSAELGVDLAVLLAKLLETNGDTSYEQLTCIGLNPNQNVLEGVIEVKLSSGYSGGLCTAGSYEYVAFWIDYGSGFSYVGTTALNVHDITNIPAGGLQYAVFQPVDFSQVQHPCQDGPKVAKVRAILSWNVAPPPSDPNYVPVWGNRQETLVEVTPGVVSEGNIPYIFTVGNMDPCKIDQTTGLATGASSPTNFTAFQSPFGGAVTITGFITNPPNVLGGAAPIKYKVSVRQSGGTWQALNNSFPIDYIVENLSLFPLHVLNYSQNIDVDGYYTYLEQSYPNQWLRVDGQVLARWYTTSAMTDQWEIKIEAKLPDGTIVSGGTSFCQDGSARSSVIVDLDQAAPSATVAITGYSRGGGPVQPATDCGKFQVGDVISGTYSTFDADGHFNSLSLGVLPSGNPVNPSSRAYPVVSTNGEAGTWTLDTTGMEPCGYVVELTVSDRTIVSSDFIGWDNSSSAGFCLDPAPVITAAH